MTRSGPSPLPPLLEIDGNRYSRDSLPAEVQDLILQLQRADAVLTQWRRDVLVLRTAHSDLRQRLGAGLAGRPTRSEETTPSPSTHTHTHTHPINSPRQRNADNTTGGDATRQRPGEGSVPSLRQWTGGVIDRAQEGASRTGDAAP